MEGTECQVLMLIEVGPLKIGVVSAADVSSEQGRENFDSVSDQSLN